MDMNQYLSMFIDESNDHLQSLNENMLELEKAPDDIGIVQIIFRSAHTLKGMAATMGFEDLSSLTHQMENVLDLVRNEKLKMQDYIFDTLFKSLDALQMMVQDIMNGGDGKADVQSIVTSLQAIVRGEVPGERTVRLPRRQLLLLRRLALAFNWTSSSIPSWSNRSLKATRCCTLRLQSAKTAN